MDKFEELLVKKGLYTSILLTIDDVDELKRLLSDNYFVIDCFCHDCKEERTFEMTDTEIHEHFMAVNMPAYSNVGGQHDTKEDIFERYLNKRYSISFRCTRNGHLLLFDLLIINDRMFKIGQYPSFADISIGDVAKYKSVLGEKFREYNKALGLFSHGIGIGSFVYMRRIIESLVFEKYDEKKEMLGISKEDFIRNEFKDKIDLLKDFLPDVLVENKNIYGIISKGLHELSEEECLNMFPYIKAGIELILDEIIAEKKRIEKQKIFSKCIADKTAELRNKQ